MNIMSFYSSAGSLTSTSGTVTTTGNNTFSTGTWVTATGSSNLTINATGTGNVGWSSTGTVVTTTVGQTYTQEYYLWGETLDIEKSNWVVAGHNNEKYIIAQLECMGTKYWESLKKNDIKSDLDDDFYNQINEAYKRKKREENINDVLD